MSKKRFLKNLMLIFFLSAGLFFGWTFPAQATINSFPDTEYIEDFETATAYQNPPLPIGWVGTYNFKTYAASTANHTPSGAWGTTVKAGTGTTPDVLTSDTVDYTGYQDVSLNFYIKGLTAVTGTESLTVYYSTNGGTDWTLIPDQTGMNPFPDDEIWHKCGSSGDPGYTFTMPNLDGQSNVKYKFSIVRQVGNMYFDDVIFGANAPPTIDEVTISPTPVQADDSTLHYITVKATDANGPDDFGSNHGIMALVYRNTTWAYARGYFAWHPDNYVHSDDQGACGSGGGYVSKSSGYGGEYVTLVPSSCSTTTDGNQRTVVFAFTANDYYGAVSYTHLTLPTSDLV